MERVSDLTIGQILQFLELRDLAQSCAAVNRRFRSFASYPQMWRLACASIIPDKYHPLLYYVKAPLPAMYMQWSRMQPSDVVASIKSLAVVSRLAMHSRSPQFLALRAGVSLGLGDSDERATGAMARQVSMTQHLLLDGSKSRIQREFSLVNRAAANPFITVRRWCLGTADADWVDRSRRKLGGYHIASTDGWLHVKANVAHELRDGVFELKELRLQANLDDIFDYAFPEEFDFSAHQNR